MGGERRSGERKRIGDILVDGEALMRERRGGRDEIGEREIAGAVFPPGELQPATVPGTPIARPL